MRIDVRGDIVEDELLRFYEWWGAPATAPGAVIKQLKEAKDGEAIDVYINSPGGSVFAGAEIYSELRGRNVTVHITGLAASAASVIACAGKKTLISPAGCMMIHNVQGGAWGDYHELERTAEALKQVGRTISSAYEEKTGKTEKELLKLMDAETWMNAADCVANGFCDAVEERPVEAKKTARMAAAAGGFTLTPEMIEKARAALDGKAKPESGSRAERARAKLKLLGLASKRKN